VIVVLYKQRSLLFDIFEGTFEDVSTVVMLAGNMVREEDNVRHRAAEGVGYLYPTTCWADISQCGH